MWRGHSSNKHECWNKQETKLTFSYWDGFSSHDKLVEQKGGLLIISFSVLLK